MKKILIIEDDQLVANIYRNKLTVEGFQVEIARDGQAGLDMARSFVPDLVLLDLVLPVIPGIEVMKTLRADQAFEKMPVIVFSNTYLTNMIQDAWKAGATKCLSKANCTPREVIKVVRSSLGINGTAPVKTSQTEFLKSAAPHPESAAATGEQSSDADAQFQSELRGAFVAGLPAVLAELRVALQAATKAEHETTRLKELHELYRRTHSLTGNAAITGMPLIAQVSDALEALAKELYENTRNVTPSTLRTVANAIDFLGFLIDRGPALDAQSPPGRALIVDDEEIAIKAISYALDKARLKSMGVEDPVRALEMLPENKFDLVVLDVGMPNMDGFEFCAKLRSLSSYRTTPVIFVTSLNDFETRANSTMSGGNDLIAKPFLFIELAIKALIHVLRARLEPVPA